MSSGVPLWKICPTLLTKVVDNLIFAVFYVSISFLLKVYASLSATKTKGNWHFGFIAAAVRHYSSVVETVMVVVVGLFEASLADYC